MLAIDIMGYKTVFKKIPDPEPVLPQVEEPKTLPQEELIDEKGINIYQSFDLVIFAILAVVGILVFIKLRNKKDDEEKIQYREPFLEDPPKENSNSKKYRDVDGSGIISLHVGQAGI